jgi:hypothetical protein
MLGYSRSVAHSAAAIRQLKEDAASCRRSVEPGHIPLGDKCELLSKASKKQARRLLRTLQFVILLMLYSSAF